MVFLGKSTDELPEEERGIAISTYGKVIKRGWDWIGISPRNPTRLTGIVENPQFSEILTTNKADFLRDANSLPKYYRYRRAIQVALEPIFRKFGETSPPRDHVEEEFRPLEKEIEQVLKNMLNDFPELSPLLGRKRGGESAEGVIPDSNAPAIGKTVEGVDVFTGTVGGSGKGSGIEGLAGGAPGQRIEPAPEQIEPGKIHEGKRKPPGLMIAFEESPDRMELGWLIESTVWINKSHPAYKRAAKGKAEDYHIIISVAWILSEYLEAEKSPLIFINQFLSSWGATI